MTVGGFSFIHMATPLNTDLAFAAAGVTGCCSVAMSVPSCHTQSKCIVYAAALVAGGAVIGYFIGSTLAARRARCNSKVQLGCAKVADSIDIEDIGEKKAFCRCWKSDKWPYCDGSHNKHNKETGDNVGPLVIKGKPAAQ